jgi:hypothetical protein
MHGVGFDVPKSTTLVYAAPAPAPSGAMVPNVSRLLLLGSPNFSPPPSGWRLVEDNVKCGCLQVTFAERLHKTLASVDQNILRPKWVSLKNERKTCLCASSFL